jgi:hypothetical protein
MTQDVAPRTDCRYAPVEVTASAMQGIAAELANAGPMMEREKFSDALTVKVGRVLNDVVNWRNEHVGSVRPYSDGEREMRLRLVEKFPYADDTGHCYRFADDSDRCFVWFSRRNSNLEVGAVIQARFIIKSHRVYSDGVWENVFRGGTEPLAAISSNHEDLGVGVGRRNHIGTYRCLPTSWSKY